MEKIIVNSDAKLTMINKSVNGIELTDGRMINEVRFCQRKQDEWLKHE